jgi:hypothetical protein
VASTAARAESSGPLKCRLAKTIGLAVSASVAQNGKGDMFGHSDCRLCAALRCCRVLGHGVGLLLSQYPLVAGSGSCSGSLLCLLVG